MATGGADGGDNGPMFDDSDDHSLDLTDVELLWDKKLKEAINMTVKQDAVGTEKEASKGDELNMALKETFKKTQDGDNSKAMSEDRYRQILKEFEFDKVIAQSKQIVKGEHDVEQNVMQETFVKDIAKGSSSTNKTEQVASEDQQDIKATNTIGSSPLADYSDSDIEIIEVTTAPASSPLPYTTDDSDDELEKALSSEVLQKVMEIFPHIDTPYLERTYWRLQRTFSKKQDLFEEVVRYLLERQYPREDDPQPCSVTVCDGQITEVKKDAADDTSEQTHELCPYEEMEDSGVVEFGGDDRMEQSDGSMKMKGSGAKAPRYSPYKLHGTTTMMAGRGKHNISGKTRIKSSVNKRPEAFADCPTLCDREYIRSMNTAVGTSSSSSTSLAISKPSDTSLYTIPSNTGLHVKLSNTGLPVKLPDSRVDMSHTVILSTSQRAVVPPLQSSRSYPVMSPQGSSATNTTASLSTVTSDRINSLKHKSLPNSEPSETSWETKISQIVQTDPHAVNSKPVTVESVISPDRIPYLSQSLEYLESKSHAAFSCFIKESQKSNLDTHKVTVTDHTKLSQQQRMHSPRLNFPPLPPERRISTSLTSAHHRPPLVPSPAKRTAQTHHRSPLVPSPEKHSAQIHLRAPLVPSPAKRTAQTPSPLAAKRKPPTPPVPCRISSSTMSSLPALSMSTSSSASTKTVSRNTEPEMSEKVSSKPTMILCEGCNTSYGYNKMVQCCDGHILCIQCVEKAAKAVLVGDKKGFVACCLDTCNSSVPKSELRKALPSIVLDLLEEQWKKETLDALENMTDIVKCPGCTFSAALDIGVKCFSCANCNQSFCRYCEMQWPSKSHELCIKMTSRSSVVSGSNILIPAHWSEPINKEGYSEVDLCKNSTEYKEIKKQFKQTISGSHIKVKRVFRVQNQRLWEKYSLARGHMVDDLGEFHINEKRVFHGTSIQTIDAICKEGFDWRLCGKNATAFGHGTYFAKNASYSDRYTTGSVNPSIFGGPPGPSSYGPVTTVPAFGFGAPTTSSSPFPFSAPVTGTGPFAFGAPTTTSGSGFSFGGPQINTSGFQFGGAQTTISGFGFGSQPTTASGFQFGGAQTTTSGFGFGSQPTTNILTPTNTAVFDPSSSSSQPNAGGDGNSRREHKLWPNHKYMFVARILAGRSCHGKPSMRRPDTDKDSGKLCHSAVDSVHSPRIYVIFDSSQCYPEYLIEYS